MADDEQAGNGSGNDYTDRCVWITPARQWGRPCVGNTRVPTNLVANAWWHYPGPAETADAWNLTMEQVYLAVWFEGLYGGRTNRKRFGAWAKGEDVHLALATGKEPPVPPSKGATDADG